MNKKITWSFVIIVLALVIAYFTYNSVYAATIPAVDTVEAHLNESNATLKAMITEQGGKEISQYGFRWGTSPKLEQEETFSGSIDENEIFSASISGLEEGNTYYYQACAVNSKGSAYSEIKSFIVPVNEPPVVSIKSPEDNLTVYSGELVKLAAAATDDKKIEAMELFINDDSKKKTDGDALNYDWDTANAEPGDYTIKLTAWDGVKTGEQFITLTVNLKPVEEKPSIPVASKPPIVKDNNNSSNSSTIGNVPVSRGDSTDTYKYPKLSKAKGSYGQFHYRDTSGGRIEIDSQWLEENIVTITLPGLNQKVQVHKNAADNFITAFNLIKNGTAMINGKQVPLLSLIRTMDGTFVSRHVNWDSSRGLSNHSWGAAIDINASDHFRYVDPNNERSDPNLILWEKAFKPAGFSWGNSYSDAMHYELLD